MQRPRAPRSKHAHAAKRTANGASQPGADAGAATASDMRASARRARVSPLDALSAAALDRLLDMHTRERTGRKLARAGAVLSDDGAEVRVHALSAEGHLACSLGREPTAHSCAIAPLRPDIGVVGADADADTDAACAGDSHTRACAATRDSLYGLYVVAPRATLRSEIISVMPPVAAEAPADAASTASIGATIDSLIDHVRPSGLPLDIEENLLSTLAPESARCARLWDTLSQHERERLLSQRACYTLETRKFCEDDLFFFSLFAALACMCDFGAGEHDRLIDVWRTGVLHVDAGAVASVLARVATLKAKFCPLLHCPNTLLWRHQLKHRQPQE